MNNIKTETLHVRLSPSIKAEAEEILEEMGLNMSYAVSMFLKQVIIKRKIPFDIELKLMRQVVKKYHLNLNVLFIYTQMVILIMKQLASQLIDVFRRYIWKIFTFMKEQMF